MRTITMCLACWLLVPSFTEAGQIGNLGPNGEFVGRGSFRLWPWNGPYPFDLVLDVNGQEQRIEKEAMGRVLVELDTGEAMLTNWREPAYEVLLGVFDGSPYEIRSYPLKRNFPPSGGQIFIRTYREHEGDSAQSSYINLFDRNNGQQTDDTPIAWTEPITIDAIEPIDDIRWLLKGVSGPRWTGDITLFDEVVGGQPFTVRLKEFGFGEWGDVVAATSQYPEPSTWAILALAGLPAILYASRSRRQRRLGTS